MAKEYKYATPVCIGLSILALIGIIMGLIKANALPAVLCVLPAAAYEVYRTEGEYTKWASWGMLGILVAEAIFIIARINLNLAEFLGRSEETIGGYSVPLGDIKVVAPIIMGVLSVLIYTRTEGRYTKWLSVVILLTTLAILFILDPDIFKQILNLVIDRGKERI